MTPKSKSKSKSTSTSTPTTTGTTCYSPRSGHPLVSFYSEGEAIDGAAHVKKRYGAAQEPYHCERCGNWHLSPKGRQTPSRMCISCQKELYETMEAATARARIIERERGVRLDIYKCPFSRGYHFTDSEKRGKRNRKI